MDKTKFTINPHLDSEGFVLVAIDDRGTITLHNGEKCAYCNPPGWNEPGMQKITWADENPDTTSVDVKRAVAEVLLRCWDRIPVEGS